MAMQLEGGKVVVVTIIKTEIDPKTLRAEIEGLKGSLAATQAELEKKEALLAEIEAAFPTTKVVGCLPTSP